MTGPREWRHAEDCAVTYLCDIPGCRICPPDHCTCGLYTVRDAIAQGHRVVVGPDGVEGRLEKEWQGYTPVPVVVPLEDP